MKTKFTFIVAFFASFLASHPSKSDPNDIEDTFVRMAIKHGMQFEGFSKKERTSAIQFCVSKHKQLFDNISDYSCTLKQIIEGLERYSPEGQISREKERLFKSLESIDHLNNEELKFWKNRMSFLTLERSNLDLAHLPFALSDDNTLAPTPELRKKIKLYKKNLKGLMQFRSELIEISNGGINNKILANHGILNEFRTYILGRDSDSPEDPQQDLIQRMERIKLGFEGTLEFNSKIFSFCGEYQNALDGLDNIFENLKVRYLSLVSILKGLKPETDLASYLKVFRGGNNYSFAGVARTVADQYENLNAELSKKVTSINNLLTANHLIEASRRSRLLQESELGESSPEVKDISNSNRLIKRASNALKRSNPLDNSPKATDTKK